MDWYEGIRQVVLRMFIMIATAAYVGFTIGYLARIASTLDEINKKLKG